MIKFLRMKKTFLIFSLPMLLLFACQSKNTIEKVKATHKDGTPRVVEVFEPTGKDTLIKEEINYHPNGEVYFKGEYKDQKKNGLWTSFYPDGGKWSETVFKEGKTHGKTISWHKNGEKHFEGFYTNGKPSGHWIFYDQEGNKTYEKDY